jgi:hypothetical protein
MIEFYLKPDAADVRAVRRAFQYIDIKHQRKFIRQAMRAVMKAELLPQLKGDAPVKSGRLKKGLKIRAAKRSRKHIGLVSRSEEKLAKGQGQENVFYGPFQEYGWKHAGSKRKIKVNKGWMRRIAKRRERLVVRKTIKLIAENIGKEFAKG